MIRKGAIVLELNKKTLRNVFIGVAACIVLYWLLHETERVKGFLKTLESIFEPFIVGAALAFVLNVPMRGFEGLLKGIKQPGLRRIIAVVLTFIAILLVLLVVVQLLLPQLTQTIQSLISKLPAFFDRALEMAKDFLADNPELMKWLKDNTELEDFNWSELVQKAVTLFGDGVSTVVDKAFAAIGSLSTGVFNAVIGIVFALYCLFRKEILARQGRRLLYAFLPEKVCDHTVRIMRLTSATFSNFLSGQCLEALILGCLFAISMLIFGMPYIPLVSVLVAVTALVPIVGAFVGCILGAFFILVDNPLQAVWFVVMFLVIQQIEGNVIYPKVVGKSVGLPGMWVLMAVSVGGELMGVGGMLLMIPLVSVMYTLLREITQKRLTDRGIAQEKLMDQPPETRSRLANPSKTLKKKRVFKFVKKAEKTTPEQSDDHA